MDKLSTKNSIVREIPSDSRSRGIELSVIIVDYKSTDFTIRLVADLLTKLSKLRFEIIVVDNNPESRADKKIRGHFKDDNLKVIKAKKNAGFGSGNNLGAVDATGEFLLLLNPDTEIVDGAIETMLNFLAKHPEIGALTPLIYQRDGKTLQRHFFGRFQTLANMLTRRQAGVMAKNPPKFFYAEMITAAALMIRSELFEKLSGFDQNFFMYLEDEDLCRRISKLGLKNAVLTSAKIIHLEGQSSTSFEKKKFYYKSQDYYWQKHYGRFLTVVMKIVRFPYIIFQRIGRAD